MFTQILSMLNTKSRIKLANKIITIAEISHLYDYLLCDTDIRNSRKLLRIGKSFLIQIIKKKGLFVVDKHTMKLFDNYNTIIRKINKLDTALSDTDSVNSSSYTKSSRLCPDKKYDDDDDDDDNKSKK